LTPRPKISTEQRQYYKSRIRSVIAQHPQISQVALAATLEADGLKLHRKYLGSLLNDIYTERAKRANPWVLNHALSAFQDVMMEISAVAWSIANDELLRLRSRSPPETMGFWFCEGLRRRFAGLLRSPHRNSLNQISALLGFRMV
jgi:hypothetical protein